MKLGMIARADNRGLGIQTHEFYRHMKPAATLVVQMGPLSPYGEHLERYIDGLPDVAYATFADDRLPDQALDWLLERSDVIYSAETPYDYRLLEWARARGVATAIQGNHEFMKWITEPDLPRPDLFIAPSLWNLEYWPQPNVYLPFPVARDRLPFRRRTEARRFIHIAGHRAMQDRNGSRLFVQGLCYVRSEIQAVVRTQSRIGTYHHRPIPRNVHLAVTQDDVDNYWDLYADAGDVLVLPRRYGGQSLPMNEALSLGMPVVMLDVEPMNQVLPPEALIPHRGRRSLRCQAGEIHCYDCDPRAIAAKIDELASDPALVERLSKEADEYAEGISWRTLGPRYHEVLASLC